MKGKNTAEYLMHKMKINVSDWGAPIISVFKNRKLEVLKTGGVFGWKFIFNCRFIMPMEWRLQPDIGEWYGFEFYNGFVC